MKLLTSGRWTVSLLVDVVIEALHFILELADLLYTKISRQIESSMVNGSAEIF
ncbi:MAG: hypothetical protein ACK47D_17725 [Pseudanabaena sp.]|jgi:hypothetical protein|uniref:hypothetical protein n=1 Tax=Pseudanabaena mucicola TaxID=71190 RepID=UPI0025765413|nr:hypothetical protein [Pseudanabaena mucicola]MCA6555046.1 hypothetical protein [Pseudanabaena sp. M135S2SP2A07QC]MCA6574977.1 hypothetical protein [Pseudanabaena sp. M53BS1SP1A06MG]MCA6582085.1 hypothetical protein [Pseudanabaena sp. M34BS1SP1A06MG]MCA6586892.1 hypothetical protein [Pseudanabaena sp. M051S1SP1A06QC]MCA6590033.1 hypothetical protein [Pseudanabaena sp. M109S1SP1A06QC]MCA6592194.1 hypothetical protein [Pseudanabaena sp. M38BS1SP1A06MG]MCA6596369.1 hypothetical protein [Pseud